MLRIKIGKANGLKTGEKVILGKCSTMEDDSQDVLVTKSKMNGQSKIRLQRG